MGERRRGRELALQVAYAMDMGGLDVAALDEALQSLPLSDEDSPADAAPPDEGRLARSREFARFLVLGAWKNRGRIDDLIRSAAVNWLPSRMPALDRNILRLACFELLYAEDIPPKATINEWIEVAKRYSTEQSGAFVNGILDQVRLRGSPEHAADTAGEAGG